MNEREADVLGAAARIICIVRALHEKGNRTLRDDGTLDRCLRLYDDAVRRMKAPSAYERIKDPTNLEGEEVEEQPMPEPGANAPPVPEPFTQSLYRTYYAWESVQQEAKQTVDSLSAKQTDGSAPPSPELQRAYKRHFKAQDVCSWLLRAINEAMSDYIDDESEAGIIKMHFRTMVATATDSQEPDPAPAADPTATERTDPP